MSTWPVLRAMCVLGVFWGVWLVLTGFGCWHAAKDACEVGLAGFGAL